MNLELPKAGPKRRQRQHWMMQVHLVGISHYGVYSQNIMSVLCRRLATLLAIL